jgi:4a-hydroxytetrahydrobiopterin dehydratase
MSETFCDLAKGKCKPCEGGIPPLTPKEIGTLMPQLNAGWAMVDGKLRRDFKFPDHYITMTFVNAVAWVSHQQGHHPDLAVGYNTCRVEYVTHAISGLSESDFICAAKVDALFDL